MTEFINNIFHQIIFTNYESYVKFSRFKYLNLSHHRGVNILNILIYKLNIIFCVKYTFLANKGRFWNKNVKIHINFGLTWLMLCFNIKIAYGFIQLFLTEFHHRISCNSFLSFLCIFNGYSDFHISFCWKSFILLVGYQNDMFVCLFSHISSNLNALISVKSEQSLRLNNIVQTYTVVFSFLKIVVVLWIQGRVRKFNILSSTAGQYERYWKLIDLK